jgi:uncharacterized protein YjbI with pentapeptide repeats
MLLLEMIFVPVRAQLRIHQEDIDLSGKRPFKDSVGYYNYHLFGVDLDSSHFESKVVFNNCVFKEVPIFEGSVFKQGLFLINDTLQKTGKFYGLITDTASFTGTVFKQTAHLTNVNFKTEVSFAGTTFGPCAFFSTTIFNEGADFQGARFGRVADFSFDILGEDATFNFLDAHLPHLIDLSHIEKIPRIIDLSEANFSDYDYSTNDHRHYINLYGSDIGKVKFDYQHFRLCFYNPRSFESPVNTYFKILGHDTISYDEKKYHIDETLPEKLLAIPKFRDYIQDVFPSAGLKDTIVHDFIIHWASFEYGFPNALSDDEVKASYQKVLKYFETTGQKQSYEELDIEYRKFTGNWFDLSYWWNRYGYRKELIFSRTLYLFIFFYAFTYLLIPQLTNKNGKEESVYFVESTPEDLKKIRVRAWFAFTYTLSLFLLLSLKSENLNLKKGLSLYILAVYAIGIICLAYLGAFVLQK